MTTIERIRAQVRRLDDEYVLNEKVQMRLANDDLLELAAAAGAACPPPVKFLVESLRAGARPDHCIVAARTVKTLLAACDGDGFVDVSAPAVDEPTETDPDDAA